MLNQDVYSKINHLVAEHVMGWEVWNNQWSDKETKEMVYIDIDFFKPSVDMQDAWKVAEKLGLCVVPQSNGKGGYRWFVCDVNKISYKGVSISIEPIEDTEYSADTAPLAICLCALLSKGIDLELPF